MIQREGASSKRGHESESQERSAVYPASKLLYINLAEASNRHEYRYGIYDLYSAKGSEPFGSFTLNTNT